MAPFAVVFSLAVHRSPRDGFVLLSAVVVVAVRRYGRYDALLEWATACMVVGVGSAKVGLASPVKVASADVEACKRQSLGPPPHLREGGVSS